MYVLLCAALSVFFVAIPQAIAQTPEGPAAPNVRSEVFSNPSAWYNTPEGIFTWELPEDVTAVAVEIATSSEHVPQTVTDTPTESFAVTSEDLTNGVQYVSVQFKDASSWGAVTNRKLQIDTEPPQPFGIEVRTPLETEDSPVLFFATTDDHSGVAGYVVTIAGHGSFPVAPEDAASGYPLAQVPSGTYTIDVTARDFAGNEQMSSAPVVVMAQAARQPGAEGRYGVPMIFDTASVVIIILVLVSLVQLAYVIFEHVESARRETKLRTEIREVHQQTQKIFSALRDEIYDQINTINSRPRLTKKEKQAVDGLSRALEVSETLIEKEIEDVEKLVK